MSHKVIARIKGGLGNQLFCYAAARRLALANNAELVIDDVTGFVRDHTYQRRYALDYFSIPCRKATPWERMEPMERGRRAISKWLARRQPFENRFYIEQQGSALDARLLALKLRHTIYLDGLWQDERYFSDIAPTIRAELRFRSSSISARQRLVQQISEYQSVALHVRWFDKAILSASVKNLTDTYYQQAIQMIEQRVKSAHYFLFSDDIEAAVRKLQLPPHKVTCVDHHPGDDSAILDLWLMSQCKHFIMANSTFSWWGAWLGRSSNGLLLMPADVPRMTGGLILEGNGNLINDPEIV